MKRNDILGVGFDNLDKAEAVDFAYGLIDGKSHRIVTPNSEIVYEARKNEELKAVLNASDLVVPDGVGVVLASKILRRKLKCKVAGIELGEALIAKMAESGKSLFLLGAKPGVAEAAAAKLQEKYPGLVIAGVHDGYFKDDEAPIKAINESKADVCFVCLGAPKQELWMAKNKDKLNCLMLGLGGSLDVFAGNVQRAPKIFIKLGLEWFYRLCKEPWRIGRMMALPKFLLVVIFKRK